MNERCWSCISWRSCWYVVGWLDIGPDKTGNLWQKDRYILCHLYVSLSEREGHYKHPRVTPMAFYSVARRTRCICISRENRPFSFNKLISSAICDVSFKCRCYRKKERTKEKYLSHDNYFHLPLALMSATAMWAESLETRKKNAVSFEKNIVLRCLAFLFADYNSCNSFTEHDGITNNY